VGMKVMGNRDCASRNRASVDFHNSHRFLAKLAHGIHKMTALRKSTFLLAKINKNNFMKSNALIKTGILLCIIVAINKESTYAQKIIPIQFPEYNISVETSFKIGDTILWKYTSNEFFKFVLFDPKGKCYCERYINKKLYQKGYYENSLDTLKKYVASLYIHGKSSKLSVLKFFEPLKNGEWITYEKGTIKKELWVKGILSNKLVPD
jgi:hypothetical protein